MGNVNLKNSIDRKSDIKILTAIIVVFLFVVWLCTPPGNKFAQLSFFGNNTKYVFAKIFNPEQLAEYKFHKNNVRYLVDMDDKKAALKEMNLAVRTLPTYMPDDTLYGLYRDRGDLRLFYGDYKGALDDYLFIENPDMDVQFKIALLLSQRGNYKLALQYCNNIINSNNTSYQGFACVADVYDKTGKPGTSVKVYDLLIDRTPGKPRYYLERAAYKKKIGDMEGYNEDIAKAKELSPMLDENVSLVNETLHPTKFKMSY